MEVRTQKSPKVAFALEPLWSRVEGQQAEAQAGAKTRTEAGAKASSQEAGRRQAGTGKKAGAKTQT